MKLLSGADIAEFIQERHAKTTRSLQQSESVIPKLAIIRTNPELVVTSYMNIKIAYGAAIGVDVDVHEVDQKNAKALIGELNSDSSVHGIIVQIPLPDRNLEHDILNSVAKEKDVDGLADDSPFDCPTPLAILWLLAGYNIDLKGKRILIVGLGVLVGAPLLRLMRASKLDIHGVDRAVQDLKTETLKADVIISCAGAPALITADMIKENAVLVDAGVATDKNGLVGDISDDVRALQNISITPLKGGVGPLTVAALFENVLTAAYNRQG